MARIWHRCKAKQYRRTPSMHDTYGTFLEQSVSQIRQVALGHPSAAEIDYLGGDEVYRGHMHMVRQGLFLMLTMSKLLGLLW